MAKETMDSGSYCQQLQEIISGSSEGILLLRPAEGLLWANQAALDMHGVRRLSDLGGTAAGYRQKYALAYRNNHALTARQYPMDRILAGESFSDVVVQIKRHGDDGFCRYQELRGLPLAEDTDKSGMAALIIRDVTDSIEAEQRFEQTFEANPAPALICRLSDLRFVKVNTGFQKMTAYRASDILGCSIYELDILENAHNRDDAIARLKEGTTIPQTESRVRVANGGSKWVIVAGQPIQMGDEDCMLFTFIDMDAVKKTENALRESEERFSKAFRLAPMPMMVSSLKPASMLDVNDAFLHTLAYTRDDVVGQPLAKLDMWLHDQEYRQLDTLLRQAGSVRDFPLQLRCQDGTILDCLISSEAVTIQEEQCVLGVIQDITERKRSEVELMSAIDSVLKDASWFSRSIIERLAQLRQPQDSNVGLGQLADLTAREREVLGLVCQGLGDLEIASTLNVSRNTVRNHLAAIYSKVGVHKRSAVIVWARERGVIAYDKPPSRRKGS
jgi:PAS domain S-box-containing protein